MNVLHDIAKPAFKYGLKFTTRNPLRPRVEDMDWHVRKKEIAHQKSMAVYTTQFLPGYHDAFLWLRPFNRAIHICARIGNGIGNREVVESVSVILMESGNTGFLPSKTKNISIKTFESVDEAKSYISKAAKRIRHLADNGQIDFLKPITTKDPREPRETDLTRVFQSLKNRNRAL